MNRIFTMIAVAAALLALGTQGWAAPAAQGGLEQGLLAIQHRWAHINYETPEDQRAKAFEGLEKQADALAARYPGRVEPRIWKAITLSTHAGVAGPFSALGLAKQARDLLVAAEKQDPTALDGSIYTSLGTLYSRVPGWPIGFGSDKKAKACFARALAVNPRGLDPNYLYARFLYDQHEDKQAMAHLQKALQAPARPQRPLADKGRREEVRALLAKVRGRSGDALAANQGMD